MDDEPLELGEPDTVPEWAFVGREIARLRAELEQCKRESEGRRVTLFEKSEELRTAWKRAEQAEGLLREAFVDGFSWGWSDGKDNSVAEPDLIDERWRAFLAAQEG